MEGDGLEPGIQVSLYNRVLAGTDGTAKEHNCREITAGLLKGVWTGLRELTKDGKHSGNHHIGSSHCPVPISRNRIQKKHQRRKAGVAVCRAQLLGAQRRVDKCRENTPR